MGNIPPTRLERLRFYTSRLEPWEEHSTGIGVDPLMVAELAQLAQEAQEAFVEQRRAYNQARAATAAFRDKIAEMSARGSVMVTLINSHAQATGDRTVYERAQISPPAAPSPLGPPGTPGRLKAALRPDGALEIAWKCRNPRGATGTVYEVRRALGAAPSEHLGLTGAKRFIDDSLPAGTALVTYRVTAARGSLRSQPGALTVTLGAQTPPALRAAA